jgi:hypothetical protein
VAAIGPAGVAFHTHQIVKMFHNANEIVAQPIIAKVSFQLSLYCALTNNNGNNPINKVMQLAPSHGIDNNPAVAIQSANFVLFENFRLNSIIMQRYKKNEKIVLIDSF